MKKIAISIILCVCTNMAYPTPEIERPSKTYIDALCDSALNYYSEENYIEALNLGMKLKRIVENYHGQEDSDYIISLRIIANSSCELGKYPEAIRSCEEALERTRQSSGINNIDYIAILSDLATYRSMNGEYKEAISLGKEALRLKEELPNDKDSDYIFLQERLAAYEKSAKVDSFMVMGSNMMGKGEYIKARSQFEKAQKVCEIEFGLESVEYAQVLVFLSLTYLHNKDDLTRGVKLMEEAKDLYNKNRIKIHSDYAAVLNNLTLAYYNVNRISDAICVGEEALEIQEKVHGKKHSAYATTLNILGTCYSKLGKRQLAFEKMTSALQIRKEIMDEIDSIDVKAVHELSISYNNFAVELSKHELFKEAVTLEMEALMLDVEVLGREHPSIDYSLRNLAILNFGAHNFKAMEENVAYYQSVASTRLSRVLSELPEEGRNNYWKECGHDWFFRDGINELTHAYPSAKMVECGYNATLLSKGILMNLTKDMSELILESKDAHLIQLYNEVKNNHLTLQERYKREVVNRVINADSLEAVTREKEQELIKKSKVYGDFTKNINISWKEVQNKLGDKDVAVDFVSFHLDQDRIMYAAYVLQKNMSAPKMVSLFEERQLKKDQMLYKTPDAGNLIWKPLSAYLRGKENVYFAPSGELYNIAIESIPHWKENCRMSDIWNMYRLSSTRELALVKDKNKIEQACVYGGVRYDTQEETLISDSRKYQRARDLNFAPRYQLADSLNIRSGVQYLPSTREEAIEIDNTLKQKHVKTVLRIDNQATESEFKNIDGRKNNLIHIATHGFYWTEREAKYMTNLNFLAFNDDGTKYTEDKDLTRSGLLLAGANNALKGKRLPEGVDDGILTAKEISKMDLRGADMVVLSACQTGIGEIKGDGVFGLQRGFKKAGVQSILMSLWKVDDEATMLLMTQFYKNLISDTGMSKHDALKQAQKYVREYDGMKYQDPYYWASFILLDAID